MAPDDEARALGGPGYASEDAAMRDFGGEVYNLGVFGGWKDLVYFVGLDNGNGLRTLSVWMDNNNDTRVVSRGIGDACMEGVLTVSYRCSVSSFSLFSSISVRKKRSFASFLVGLSAVAVALVTMASMNLCRIWDRVNWKHSSHVRVLRPFSLGNGRVAMSGLEKKKKNKKMMLKDARLG